MEIRCVQLEPRLGNWCSTSRLVLGCPAPGPVKPGTPLRAAAATILLFVPSLSPVLIGATWFVTASRVAKRVVPPADARLCSTRSILELTHESRSAHQ